MTFIKYLWNKPLKLLWLIAVYIFTTIVSIVMIIDRKTMIQDNSLTLYVVMRLFILLIAVLASAQVYTEYKKFKK